MTDPSMTVNATDDDESKRIIVHKDLSQSCSTNKSKLKISIVNKNLSQKNYADVSEYTITEQKDEEYKKSAVTKEVRSYFNVFECGRNILDRLDVTC